MNGQHTRWLLAGMLLLGLSGLGGVAAGQEPPPPLNAAPDAKAGVTLNSTQDLLTASTYSLSWWSADGGGTSYAAAGRYLLAGTVGQAEAAAPRTSGNYTLTGGFVQPSCSAAAVAPTITRAGSSITLAWTHNTANQAYQVHRATTPYFAPTDATRRAIVTAAPWSYTDPEAVIGDPSTNHYYVLRATCGAAYADPGRRGEFDFLLTPGH